MKRLQKPEPSKRHFLVGVGRGLCVGALLSPFFGYVFRILYRASLPVELQRLTRGVALNVQEVLIAGLLMVVMLSIGITLIRIGRSKTRASPFPVIRPCPDCGYELAGLDQPRRCPECSYELNPDLIPIPGWGKKSPAKLDDFPPSKPV